MARPMALGAAIRGIAAAAASVQSRPLRQKAPVSLHARRQPTYSLGLITPNTGALNAGRERDDDEPT